MPSWLIVPKRHHAPATTPVREPRRKSAPRHDTNFALGTGFQVRPPSPVVNMPDGNAALPSPQTKPVFSSKNRTACRPGSTFVPISSHLMPPSVVRSITPIDPPPLAVSVRPTAHPVYGVWK